MIKGAEESLGPEAIGDPNEEFAGPNSEGIQNLLVFERWVRFTESMEEHAEDVNGYEIGPGAFLVGADLVGAFLVGADLEGADLTKANLTKANLTKANLRWADLREANLSGADLKGAKANKDTTWPEGFDPEVAGVIFD